MSSQQFRSCLMGSKVEDTLECVEVHEEMEEMESVLVKGDGGIAIAIVYSVQLMF